MFTLKEAGEMLGFSSGALASFIRKGWLEAEKQTIQRGWRWMVSEDAIISFLMKRNEEMKHMPWWNNYVSREQKYVLKMLEKFDGDIDAVQRLTLWTSVRLVKRRWDRTPERIQKIIWEGTSWTKPTKQNKSSTLK